MALQMGNWSYNPYKWPYKWVTGVITPYKWPYKWVTGVITPYKWSYGALLTNGEGAHIVEPNLPS